LDHMLRLAFDEIARQTGHTMFLFRCDGSPRYYTAWRKSSLTLFSCNRRSNRLEGIELIESRRLLRAGVH
jgi:hypothetical protein